MTPALREAIAPALEHFDKLDEGWAASVLYR
jgi:hypothetical protein